MSFTKVTAAGIGTTGTITYTNVSVAGVITATSATFTGNVSVGGTLTYEDVTNVDSVGLITARSGVSITGGGLVVTGVTTVSAGSTSAPSISPTGDTNTGIFFPSADTIAFGEGGVEAARIDSSGRFGIGTISPNAKLTITETANANAIVIRNADTNGSNLQFGINTAIPAAYIQSTKDGSGTAQPLAFYSATAEMARFDTSGRLLVGTTTARANLYNSTVSSQFQIEGTATTDRVMSVISSSSSDAPPCFVLGKQKSGSIGGNTIIASGDSMGSISFQGNDGSEFVEAANIAAQVDGTPGANDMPGRLVFSTTADGASSPTERMRLDSSGRCGIGNTVAGTIDAVNGAGNLVVGSGSGTQGITIYSGTAGAGILNFADGTSSTATYVGQIAYRHNEDSLAFTTGVTERFRCDSSGRLLVGTSSSSAGTRLVLQGNSSSAANQAILHIQKGSANPSVVDQIGEIKFADSNGSVGAEIAAYNDLAWATNDYPGRLVFSTTADGASSPTERMRINSGGSIKAPGVYNLTTASAANVFVASDGDLARSTSSSKYKTDIETIQDSYSDALLNCRPVWYRSTCVSDNSNWGWWGFIAEEVASIDPRLVHWKTVEVTYDEKGSAVSTPCDPEPEGVAYDRFVPHLLNLIKRQKEQIEAMEARLSALESA